jgi:hypothetical protein
MVGRIERLAGPPTSPVPMRGVDHTPACHAPAADPPPAPRAPARPTVTGGAGRYPLAVLSSP